MADNGTAQQYEIDDCPAGGGPHVWQIVGFAFSIGHFTVRCVACKATGLAKPADCFLIGKVELLREEEATKRLKERGALRL